MSVTHKKMMSFLKRQKADARRRMEQAMQEIKDIDLEIADIEIKEVMRSGQQESKGAGIGAVIPIAKPEPPGGKPPEYDDLEDVGRRD